MELFNLKEYRRSTNRGGGRGAPRSYKPMEVRFGIKKPYSSNKKPLGQLVLTDEVRRELGWLKGDKMNVLYNDDIVVIERDNGGFWSLRQDGTTHNFIVSFVLIQGKYADKFEGKGREPIQFEVQDGTLVARW